MTRDRRTEDEERDTADLASSDRAASADGLPLPPPDDDETLRAREGDEPGSADEEIDRERKADAAEIAAERGAD